MCSRRLHCDTGEAGRRRFAWARRHLLGCAGSDGVLFFGRDETIWIAGSHYAGENYRQLAERAAGWVTECLRRLSAERCGDVY